MRALWQGYLTPIAAVAIGCATVAESPASRSAAVETVREEVHPIVDDPRDYDALIELIGDNQFVLLGEATHGTREFYRERARITRRLIEEKGFTVVGSGSPRTKERYSPRRAGGPKDASGRSTRRASCSAGPLIQGPSFYARGRTSRSSYIASQASSGRTWRARSTISCL